jgi:hypothetical protein
MRRAECGRKGFSKIQEALNEKDCFFNSVALHDYGGMRKLYPAAEPSAGNKIRGYTGVCE